MSFLNSLSIPPEYSDHADWKTLRQVLRNWEIKAKFKSTTEKKTPSKARYVCSKKECCDWRCTANMQSDGMIRLHVIESEHTCANALGELKFTAATSKEWLDEVVPIHLNVNKETKPAAIVETVATHYSETISYQVALMCLHRLTDGDLGAHRPKHTMPSENSSPAPKRRKMYVDSNVPKLISCSPFPPNTVSPEWHITAGWHEEPNIALQDEWMRYIWGLYRRGNTILTGVPYCGIIPKAWTLKQLSNPRAAKIFEEAEEQIQPGQRARQHSKRTREDLHRAAPEFSVVDWAKFRRESLWPVILNKVFEIISDNDLHRTAVHQYIVADDWWDTEGFNTDLYDIDVIRAMVFKDEESMVFQDWVAPIDVCHQLEEMALHIRNNRKAESEVPKSAELQAELDKYFGRLNREHDSSLAYDVGMEYMKAAEDTVWQTPEFAVLVEEFRKFAACCHAIEKRKRTEDRLKYLASEVDRLSSELQARKEELEKQTKIQELDQLAESENPGKFRAFDAFWSSWSMKIQKAKERRASGVKYPEPNLG